VRQNLPSFLIKYTFGGEGRLKYDGQEQFLREGQLFWLDCTRHQHYNTSPESDSWNIIWVHFYGESARQYYELFLSQNGGSNVLTMPADNSVQDKLKALVAMYGSSVGDFMVDVEASGILTSLLLEIIKSTSRAEQGAGIPEFVSAAKEHLTQNYQESISLDDLSELYHINKYHFLRLFKRYVGLTPNEFLIQTRLNKAKVFLRTTKRTVTEISSMVGVPNTSHFINLFKKHEQMTPHAYRQTWYSAK
jgi:AraC-like DNA-binding protein